MAGRRKLGSASLKTGRLIWPCLAGERGPDGRGKWPYAVLTILVVSGIVPDELDEYAYIFKMPSCSTDDWQIMERKYKELKELATQKGLIIQEGLEILEKSSLFQ